MDNVYGEKVLIYAIESENTSLQPTREVTKHFFMRRLGFTEDQIIILDSKELVNQSFGEAAANQLKTLSNRIYENSELGMARQILHIGIAETQDAFKYFHDQNFDLTMSIECTEDEARKYFFGVVAKMKAKNLTWINFSKQHALFRASEELKIEVDSENKAESNPFFDYKLQLPPDEVPVEHHKVDVLNLSPIKVARFNTINANFTALAPLTNDLVVMLSIPFHRYKWYIAEKSQTLTIKLVNGSFPHTTLVEREFNLVAPITESLVLEHVHTDNQTAYFVTQTREGWGTQYALMIKVDCRTDNVDV